MKIAVLASKSFIGKNLVENLKNIRDGKNRTHPNLSVSDIYEDVIYDADVIIMLPGAMIDKSIVGKAVIFISSIDGDAQEDNLPEGTLIYRLPEIVGKWQKPDEGLVARYCYSIANDESYEVKNSSDIMEVLFIEDFIEEMIDALQGHINRCDISVVGRPLLDSAVRHSCVTLVPNDNGKYCYSQKTIRTTVEEIVNHLEDFNRLNTTLIISEMPVGSLAHKLYSMYLSYLPERKMSYPVNMSIDNRGVFTELFKTTNNGQVSINIARPGNVRGQHWHNSKWEIFIVVSGHGLIQQRQIGTDKVYNFEVRGEDMRAVIMLPGYTHNIINLEDDRDLVTVMFANEQFDPDHPDTFFEVVEDINLPQ